MTITSYRDIMNVLYYQDDIFRNYVDNWSLLNGLSRHFAFENADVQRKAQSRLEVVGEKLLY